MKFLILFLASIFSFSQSHKLEIEIPNVDEEGIIYIAIYDNAKDFDSGNNSPEIMALNIIEPIKLGQAQLISRGEDVLIISYGTILKECKIARDLLQSDGITPTLIDARFAKPLDRETLTNNILSHRYVVTIEEGSVGGFSAQVTKMIQDEGLLKNISDYKNIHLPDIFIDHDTQANQIITSGLDAKNIYKTIKEMLNV